MNELKDLIQFAFDEGTRILEVCAKISEADHVKYDRERTETLEKLFKQLEALQK